jgi:hypothetical protein
VSWAVLLGWRGPVREGSRRPAFSHASRSPEEDALFYWIYDLSTETLAVVMTIVFVGFSWFGAIVIRPMLRLFVRSA